MSGEFRSMCLRKSLIRSENQFEDTKKLLSNFYSPIVTIIIFVRFWNNNACSLVPTKKMIREVIVGV